jgi:4-amino-4-deoxy-L-arabinose transferase-like glycosyltransferase
LVRAAALFAGIDLLPMVPSVFAEVIINDPAVALSQGKGLVAFSMPDSVHGLDRLYAHFPPLFIFLQSLVFRVFGFSALSLRALAPLFDLAACAVFFLIIRELRRRGILDTFGAWLAALLIFFEPTLLIHSREARMESLITLLGGISLWFCLRASETEERNALLWLAAFVSAGCGLLAHPSALVIWVVPFVWSLPFFPRLGWWRWLALNATPGVLFGGISALTYGARLPQAIAQLRALAKTAPGPDLRVAELFGAMLHHNPVQFLRAGGLGLVFTLAGFGLAAWRLADSRSRKNTTLVSLAAILALQFVLLQFAIPTSGQNRAIMITPFGLICAGVALSYLSSAASRRILIAGGLAAMLQFGMTGAYLSELRHARNQRGADRFDGVVSALSGDARVAGPPEFWYAFRHRNRDFGIIYVELGELSHWIRPDAFDPYDAVILDPNFLHFEEWRQRAKQGRPYERLIHTYSRDFVVIARSFNEIR